jgi:DNA-binding MarR family transcriptional regulator
MASINSLIDQASSYIKQVLDLPLEQYPDRKVVNLPFYLLDHYEFREIQLMSKPCLFMCPQDDEPATPQIIQKHYLAVSKQWSLGSVIYLVPNLSAHNRKRLIQYKVPFIVPGNQLYLPMHGIDLREHFLQQRSVSDDCVTPATQFVLLAAMTISRHYDMTASLLAAEMNYSAMTMSRALDELAELGVAEISRSGRERRLQFKVRGSELWEATESRLRSPVRKLRWIMQSEGDWEHTFAGETALAHYTMISEPAFPVRAIASSRWKEYQELTGAQELQQADDGCILLQCWSYDPIQLAKGPYVDPPSLYLSLRSDPDERIQMCLKELLEKMPW